MLNHELAGMQSLVAALWPKNDLTPEVWQIVTRRLVKFDAREDQWRPILEDEKANRGRARTPDITKIIYRIKEAVGIEKKGQAEAEPRSTWDENPSTGFLIEHARRKRTGEPAPPIAANFQRGQGVELIPNAEYMAKYGKIEKASKRRVGT